MKDDSIDNDQPNPADGQRIDIRIGGSSGGSGSELSGSGGSSGLGDSGANSASDNSQPSISPELPDQSSQNSASPASGRSGSGFAGADSRASAAGASSLFASADEHEGIAPPVPGAVIGSGDQASPAGSQPVVSSSNTPFAPSSPLSQAGPAAQVGQSQQPSVVTSDQSSGRRWLKWLIIIIVIAALVAAGWLAYQHFGKKKPAAPAAAQNKDIPLLRVGIRQADFGGIYPNISDNDYSVSVNSQMFEGLVRYEDRSKIVPDLASTWTNPDDNTWLFTIKKGIKFHDGHTLTPADVKYSLDTMVANTSDFATTFAATISSVQLVGNDQVKITTKTTDPTLLNKLTLLDIIDANAPKGSEPSQAGTGPYEIKPGTTPGDKSVQMVAFDDYHDGRPTTRALTFTSVADSATLVKDFNAGQFDLAGAIPPGSISQAKNATLFQVSEADSNFLGFNTVQPGPVQNKLVREAIRYAVNASAVAKANGENLTPVSQVVPPSIPGYDPAIAPYKQNIQKAKQLLAQAGYPNGVTITLSVSTENDQEATEISNELKQAGITVKLDQHSNFDEFINYFSSGKAQMYVVDYASDTLDAVDVYQTTLPSANYNNPKVNDLLTQANTTLNPATRLKLLQQVAVLVDQDIPLVPFGTTADTWVMNKSYDIRQDSTSGYIPVYFYTVKLK